MPKCARRPTSLGPRGRRRAQPRPTEPCATKRDIRLAWAIHALTASGVLLGAAGLEAVVRGHPRTAIVYLIAAMIVDGIDGPIARKAQVMHALPGMDGNILDLVVDYLTCVMLPVAFMAYFQRSHGVDGRAVRRDPLHRRAVVRPHRPHDRGPLVRGFPAIWNLVAPILPAPQPALGEHRRDDHAVHPDPERRQVRAPGAGAHRRVANITVTALWLAAMLALTITWPTPTCRSRSC